ncbi:MAG TPA: class D sortase [Patescibacteria group bacterium]|nr:class D sortase [Patescibacteria group bacterium]
MNPLFPDDPQTNPSPHRQSGYILPRQEKRLDPLPGTENAPGAHAAVELIRNKIDALYAEEPSATQELQEAADEPPRSKHQLFMHELSSSGKSLADIQTAWHNYYTALPDDEKRQVWQEFYAANNRQPGAYHKYVQQQRASVTPAAQAEQAPAEPTRSAVVVADHQPDFTPENDHRSFATVKKQILRTVHSQNSTQLKAKQHLQSLAFGLGTGALVLLVVLFGFFNEVVIAPFIHPGNHAEATPIILSIDGVAPTDKNEVIIPKINLELPFVAGNSTKESDIENQLEDGVVHYPSTSVPGQGGNAAFFGHSSNNIFNKGKYKFAFVLLHELEPGDIFYLTYNGKVYTYKVFQKRVVEPTETSVLNPVAGKAATATLITCDPPGTSLHRLVVWGEQITPDPNGNVTAPVTQAEVPKELPSNSPSLWSRFYNWIR